MKIRTGFVSNSSSSSFIVAFENIPKSIEEVQELLFGGKKTFSYYDDEFSTYQAAKQVFTDMEESGPITFQDVIEESSIGWYEGHPEMPSCTSSYEPTSEEWRKDLEKLWNEYDKLCKEKANEMALHFLSKTKHCTYFIFEYCDNDGDFLSAMEHAGIFGNVPHITLNRH